MGCCSSYLVTAQIKIATPTDSVGSSLEKQRLYYENQRDVIDIGLIIMHKDPDKRPGVTESLKIKFHVSAAPIIEYTLATGLTGGIVGEGAFITSISVPTNTSSIQLETKYTEKKQFLLPIQSSIWTCGNKYNFQNDWRFLSYPQDSHGIGGLTTPADKFVVEYEYLRIYEFLLKEIGKTFYAGIGHQLDYHWGIKELDVPAGEITDFDKYGFSKTSVSSGIGLNILYDSRKNSLNPVGGSFYGNLEFLQNSTILGSSSNWNSLFIDLRQYISLPHLNVLAFWFYSVITLSGNPPYLDLPGTGTDTYNNTGRAYEQDRFIGKRLVDLEAEFRFGITRNGLIGAVIFCNAASVSEFSSNKFEVIYPGFGMGLRIRFNKFSNTNACLAYGIGTNGSHGLFGNLGEVF